LVAGSLAATACLLLAGCGGVIDHDEEPLPKRKVAAQTGPQAVQKFETVKGKYDGVIRGKVAWEGDRPNLEGLSDALVDQMKANKTDGPFCLSGSPLEKQQQGFRIGDNNNLGNVFVWIAAPGGQVFDVPDAQMPASKHVVVAQPHCVFLPHCSTVFAARYKGGVKDAEPPQTLLVVNDATRAGHNAQVEGGVMNRFPNKTLSPWGGTGQPMAQAEFELSPDEVEVTIRCGVHGWMRAYVRAFDHPYHAVTSVGGRDLSNPDHSKRVYEDRTAKDFGTFEIKGVPIGATVSLFAWHEELGFLTDPKGQKITLQEKNDVDLTARRK
jgi:hypothetical protein